ncbi:hypothetical protein AcW1_010300 [Taiwanofungus camphoratus]|nr:hypothetical protein AcW1_010300 [Antrodia cinnamomea]
MPVFPPQISPLGLGCLAENEHGASAATHHPPYLCTTERVTTLRYGNLLLSMILPTPPSSALSCLPPLPTEPLTRRARCLGCEERQGEFGGGPAQTNRYVPVVLTLRDA